MTLARRLPLLAATWAIGCGGPLPNGEVRSQDGTSLTASDAGADASSSTLAGVHSMTITACTNAPDVCRRAETSAPSSGLYNVSTGAGVGMLRTREQAMADTYREIRDRTSFGTKLAAAAHHVDRADGTSARVDRHSIGAAARPTTSGADPIVDASFEILDAVDRDGQVTIDATHGRTTCKVSIGSAELDGGLRRCLLEGPERPGHDDPVTPREREKRFGS